VGINQNNLAESLGVSQYTVSVALGRKGRISEKTRQKVLEAAEEQGYRPNMLAAGLRGSSTMTLGMIWPFVDPWAGDSVIAYDLVGRLQERDYSTIQIQHHEDPKILCGKISNLYSRHVDALVLNATPSQLNCPDILKLLQNGPPVIAVTREDIPGFPGDLLIHDRDLAIYQVVEYFAGTGRERPAMALSMAQESNPPKFAAFAEACSKFGIAKHPKMLLDLDYPHFPEENGQRHVQAIRKYFPEAVDIDALFCFNDIGAMYSMHELQRRGTKIPEEVAVVGFNNISPGRISTPPLATGDRKPELMALKLEEMLMERLGRPELPLQRETVHMEFVWRESAGPNPGKAAAACPLEECEEQSRNEVRQKDL
jgi:LacI family transcriptional regulator